MKLACALGLSVVAACGQESAPAQQQPLSQALERPFQACEDRYQSCRISQNPDPAACQDDMRKCLQEVATWMQQSRALIEKCREQVAQCRVTQPADALSCNGQFESCVAPAFRPGASDDDAGVSEQDAGATTSTPTEGAAGSVSVPPPVAGASGSGSAGADAPPGLPPTLPGSITAADACRSELLECLTPSADLAACATHARECLRSSLLPAL